VKQHSGFLLFLTGYPASDHDLHTNFQGKQRGNYEGTGKKIFFSPEDIPIVIQLVSSSIYKPLRASFLGIEIQSTGSGKIEFNGESLVVIMFGNH
jgi:hypothetical protein